MRTYRGLFALLLFLELARYHMWRLSQTWNGCFRIQVHRETDGGLADCSAQAAQVEPHPCPPLRWAAAGPK